MLIQVFPETDVFPEFFFGRYEGKLLIELDVGPGGVGLLHKKKKLVPLSNNRDSNGTVSTRRVYQITESGKYTVNLGGSKLSLTVHARKDMHLYDISIGGLEGRLFAGNIRVNGIKLSSLSRQNEPTTTNAPTLWERLDA
jgi:hypothetical protein